MAKRTRTAFYLFLVFIASAITHNFLYAILQKEEILFFNIAVFSFVAFIIYLIYGTIYRVKKGKPDDWWKLYILGFFGLLGFIPSLGSNLYGFYGFFGFLGFKKN